MLQSFCSWQDAKKRARARKAKKDKSGKTTVTDSFNELVRANIIENYPAASLSDWLGDLSYQNHEASLESRAHRHRLGEIKQAVMENCILPLSSKEIHEIAPLVRSVCICGPPRHGKSFLVNAICTEVCVHNVNSFLRLLTFARVALFQVGALLINMTPTVLAGKYEGRKNERKLVDMVSKVAREHAPSVILVDNAEKPWAKKVPAEERFVKPKRFARYYPKLVKSIKRGDQVIH